MLRFKINGFYTKEVGLHLLRVVFGYNGKFIFKLCKFEELVVILFGIADTVYRLRVQSGC
jgi:hypothetical protein